MPTVVSCSGSLLPVGHRQPGDEALCDFCRALALLVAPPARAMEAHDESLRKRAR
jgi:hypothetical protein